MCVCVVVRVTIALAGNLTARVIAFLNEWVAVSSDNAGCSACVVVKNVA